MTAKERVLAVWPDAREAFDFGYEIVSNDKVIGSASYRGTAIERDGYLAAWQNAAESLPAAPPQICKNCRLSKRAHTKSERGNIRYCPQGSTMFEPVAPVEAKEKEHCPNCNHKAHYALRCGALIATGSDGEFAEVRCECLNWGAEPKPTPSAKEALNITPTFGRPTVEEILQEWADGRAYGENSHFIKEFSRHALTYIESLKEQAKSQPGSSSISTEQTFEEWWDKNADGLTRHCLHYEISKRAWNAAKGQSNGR